MKFKVSSNNLFRRTAIVVEIKERGLKSKRNLRKSVPDDYWNFIPSDGQQEDSCVKSNRRVLSPAQVEVPSHKNLQQLCFFLLVV